MPPVVRPFIPHTLLPLSSAPLFHVAVPEGLPPPAPSKVHLQVCEGRSPTKADCVLIKFIICRELILKGNLSPKGKLDYSLALIPMKLLGFSLRCTADGNRRFPSTLDDLTPYFHMHPGLKEQKHIQKLRNLPSKQTAMCETTQVSTQLTF